MKVVPDPLVREKSAQGFPLNIDVGTKNDPVPAVRDVPVIHTKLGRGPTPVELGFARGDAQLVVSQEF